MVLVFALTVGATGPAMADFQAGISAYLARDYGSALRILLPLTDQGHIEAQTIIGVMYHNGQGVELDEDQARNWLLRVIRTYPANPGEPKNTEPSDRITLTPDEILKKRRESKPNSF